MRIFALLFVLLAPASIAHSQDGPAELSVLTGWRTESGTHMAAFDIKLQSGWKTYWRAPGDAGIPPRISWRSSSQVASVKIHWPRPSMHDSYGATTIGYKDRLVLPIEVTPHDGHTGPISVSGKIEIGVCLDVCVPMAFRFQADLPEIGAADHDIGLALKDVPAHKTGTAVARLGCSVAPLSDGMKVTAKLDIPSGLKAQAAIFEHNDPSIWISAADIRQKGRTLIIEAEFVPPEAQPFSLDRSEIKLTLIGLNTALEISGCPAG